MTHLQRAVLFTFLVTLAAGISAVGHYPVGVFYDDGIYLILAKALATGHGYRYLNIPGTPFATHFPPGYPAVLALLWKITPAFPSNVPLLKGANAVFLAIASATLVLFAVKRLQVSPWIAAAGVTAFSVSIPLLATAGVLFSEPLFLALLVPAIWATERLCDADARIVHALLAALLAAALVMVRSIGEPIIIAGVIVLLARRRWTLAAVYGIASILLLVPWQLWTRAHGGDVPPELVVGYGPYNEWLGNAMRGGALSFLADVVRKNVPSFFSAFVVLFTPRWNEVVRDILIVPFFAAMIVGLVALGRRAPATLLWMLGYGAIVFIWPYWPTRFMWGVWPVIGLIVALGVRDLWLAWRAPAQPAPLRWASATALAALAIMAISYSVYEVTALAKGWTTSGQKQVTTAYGPAVRWVTEHTDSSDVLAAQGEPIFYLYTGRLAVPAASWYAEEYVRIHAPAAVMQDTRNVVKRFNAKYVVVVDTTNRLADVAERMMREQPPELDVVSVLSSGGAILKPHAATP